MTETSDGTGFRLRPIGWVQSDLIDPARAPCQGDEGAPDAWIVIEPELARGVRDLDVGDAILVLTWLDRARRDVLELHPRGDDANPLTGVFSTRSPDRPNPIGLHPVRVKAIDGNRIRVGPLEAVDRTPVVDIKPMLENEPRSAAF
jgi:tRNA-Thr(GGU) m(6)t(6)A37 methyltransferase TsaA